MLSERQLRKLEIIESFRGDLAAWVLTAFGLVYFIWGMRRAVRNRTHTHFHSHGDREEHSHSHGHNKEHIHVHDKEVKANITPWILFTVFVLGPCEPLIPILMYPAAQSSLYGLSNGNSSIQCRDNCDYDKHCDNIIFRCKYASC